MSSSAQGRRLLFLLLACRLAVGLLYAVSVPVWEADNEDGHFAYARYLAVHRRLLQPGDPEAEAIFQRFQPPLYYLVIAPIIAGFDLGETFTPPPRNPFLVDGVGANYALHPPEPTSAEAALAAAVYAARAAGAVLSTLSVLAMYGATASLWPGDASRRWAATCLYAFWPQFLFTGSMVTNDVLVTALGAVSFFLAARLAVGGFRLRFALGLAAVLGLAILTKINALGLAPMAGLALLSSWLNPAAADGRRPARQRRRLIAVVTIAVALTGSVAALSSMRFVTAQVFQPRTLQDFLQFASRLDAGSTNAVVGAAAQVIFRTFLASYGWGNLETEAWAYTLWTIAAGLALLGLVIWLARRPTWRSATPVVLAATGAGSLLALALALAVAVQFRYVPGRYLLPALGPIAVLLVTGWHALAPAAWRRLTWKAAACGVCLVGWMVPAATLLPEYARPQPVDMARVEVNRSLAASFGDAIQLWGVGPPSPGLAGRRLDLSLCWVARRPVPANYPLLLEIVGPDGQGYGRLLTYPGRGNYPTGYWIVGQPFCDRYEVPVGDNYPAPGLGTVRVVFQESIHGRALPVASLGGADLGGEVRVPVVIRSDTHAPAPAFPVEYRFGDTIRLRGYDVQPLDDGRAGWRITLHWEARAPVGEDYKVFVHLRDTPETAYVQSDYEPRHDSYPTGVWTPGERILDEHELVLPAGAAPPLTLVVGLYRPEDGARPVVVDGRGHWLQDGEVVLPWPVTD